MFHSTFLFLFLSTFLTILPLVGFLTVWSFIFFRVFILKQSPFLPRHPLRRARWNGAVCCLIFSMFLFFPSFLISFFPHSESHPQTSVISEVPQTVSEEVESPISETDKSLENSLISESESPKQVTPDKGTEHVAVRYLMVNPSFLKFFFMFLYAAILAPILEEFLFRLVLQGWFDAREREFFPRWRQNGLLSMILVAILFSLIHYHAAGDFPEESTQKLQFIVSTISATLTILLGFFILHKKLSLTWQEVGLDFSHWQEDLRLGILGFFAGAFPTYVIQKILTEPLKPYCSADFIALLPIAFVFGFLYWRTRRLLPSIVTHCCYNSYSLIQLTLYVMSLPN